MENIMDKHQIKNVAAWALLILILGVLMYALPVLADPIPQDPRTEEELLMQLCINEATWNTLDCGAIGYIRKRYARARELTLRDTLILLHGDASGRPTAALRSTRFTQPLPTDDRAWIANLRSTLERPAGFPDDGSWEGRYRQAASDVLATARGVIDGTLRDPCRQGRVVPSIWGGRHLDAEHIDRRITAGYSVAHCGATVNLYLGRSRR